MMELIMPPYQRRGLCTRYVALCTHDKYSLHPSVPFNGLPFTESSILITMYTHHLESGSKTQEGGRHVTPLFATGKSPQLHITNARVFAAKGPIVKVVSSLPLAMNGCCVAL